MTRTPNGLRVTGPPSQAALGPSAAPARHCQCRHGVQRRALMSSRRRRRRQWPRPAPPGRGRRAQPSESARAAPAGGLGRQPGPGRLRVALSAGQLKFKLKSAAASASAARPAGGRSPPASQSRELSRGPRLERPGPPCRTDGRNIPRQVSQWRRSARAAWRCRRAALN
jgi:hypothetical protein